MPALGWNVAEGRCQHSSARNCELSLVSRFVEKRKLGRARLTLLKAERDSSGLRPLPLCPCPGPSSETAAAERAEPVNGAVLPFARKTFRKLG